MRMITSVPRPTPPLIEKLVDRAAISGNPSRSWSAAATVDFPAPGGPVTTTRTGSRVMETTMIPDMTEALERQLEEMTAELLDRYEELTVLYELGASLASEFDVDRIAEIAVRRAAEATGAGKGIVALEREDGLYAAALLGAVRLTPGA